MRVKAFGYAFGFSVKNALTKEAPNLIAQVRGLFQ